MHDYGNNSLKRVKTDKKDAIKLANYAIDRWLTLPQYLPDDDTRLFLKNCYRQYLQNIKLRTMLKNNLISLLDQCYPEANHLFSSPPRAACSHISTMPKSDTVKLLVEQAVSQLMSTSAAIAALQKELQSLASVLPEYQAVMQMYGVGPSLGPQLMAEIGDVRRFHSKNALVAFAGIDAPPYQSGKVDVRSRSISKRGSASLRRTLFVVMSIFLQHAPKNEPIYQFMDKKRSEGKLYGVYMMASANKFLRTYYARVRAYLDTLEAI